MKPIILNKQCIIWDWGGVCCVAGEHFANPRMLERCELTADEMSEQCRDIEIALYLGKIDGRGFWDAVKSRFPLADFSFDELHQSYLESYSVHNEVLHFIANCSTNGTSAITHALLSNLGEDMSEHIVTSHRLTDLLSPRIFSHHIGAMKPDATAFDYALREIGLPRENCVFVDDSATNVSAARELGLDSILFVSPRQALQELGEFGING